MKKQIITLCTTILLAASCFAQPRGARPPKEPDTATKEKEVAEIGEKAPAFELKDQHGNTHKLSEYEGKIVVLEWFNETCPFCVGVWGSGLIPTLLIDLKGRETEVVYLAMNSTANKPKEEVLKGGTEFLEELDIEIPMLMDYDGKVGHLYGARTTPHMYVIDTEGVLVYKGALSDDPRSKEGDKAKTHISRVVSQIEAGEEVSPSYIQPWGCPVKYKRAESKHMPANRRPSNWQH